MRNTVELEAVMQYISDNPEEWDQENWWCGSVACFAGHVAMRGKCVPLDERPIDGYVPPRMIPRLGNHREINWDMGVYSSENGKMTTVREYARDRLGLDDREAELLFASYNTLDNLQHIVKGLVNGDAYEFIKAGL